MTFPVCPRSLWILGSTCKGLSDIGTENKHPQVKSRDRKEHRITTLFRSRAEHREFASPRSRNRTQRVSKHMLNIGTEHRGEASTCQT